jgi:hypothetical protein
MIHCAAHILAASHLQGQLVGGQVNLG